MVSMCESGVCVCVRERGGERETDLHTMYFKTSQPMCMWAWHRPYLVMTFGSPLTPHKSHFLFVL